MDPPPPPPAASADVFEHYVHRWYPDPPKTPTHPHHRMRLEVHGEAAADAAGTGSLQSGMGPGISESALALLASIGQGDSKLSEAALALLASVKEGSAELSEAALALLAGIEQDGGGLSEDALALLATIGRGGSKTGQSKMDHHESERTHLAGVHEMSVLPELLPRVSAPSAEPELPDAGDAILAGEDGLSQGWWDSWDRWDGAATDPDVAQSMFENRSEDGMLHGRFYRQEEHQFYQPLFYFPMYTPFYEFVTDFYSHDSAADADVARGSRTVCIVGSMPQLGPDEGGTRVILKLAGQVSSHQARRASCQFASQRVPADRVSTSAVGDTTVECVAPALMEGEPRTVSVRLSLDDAVYTHAGPAFHYHAPFHLGLDSHARFLKEHSWQGFKLTLPLIPSNGSSALFSPFLYTVHADALFPALCVYGDRWIPGELALVEEQVTCTIPVEELEERQLLRVSLDGVTTSDDGLWLEYSPSSHTLEVVRHSWGLTPAVPPRDPILGVEYLPFSPDHCITTDFAETALLDSLELSAGRLEPPFEPETFEYTVMLERSDVTDFLLALTPTTSDWSATILVAGVAVPQGQPVSSRLRLGENRVAVKVASKNKHLAHTYVVRIFLLSGPSDEGGLTVLIPSTGELDPLFDMGETGPYTLIVESDISDVFFRIASMDGSDVSLCLRGGSRALDACQQVETDSWSAAVELRQGINLLEARSGELGRAYEVLVFKKRPIANALADGRTEPFGLPTSSALTLTVRFSDGTCSDFSQDNRVVMTVVRGATEVFLESATAVAAPSGAGLATVAVAFRHYTLAEHLHGVVNITVVRLASVALAAHPFPSFGGSAAHNLTRLQRVHCSDGFQRATLHLHAQLTDGVTHDVTNQSVFLSGKPEVVMVQRHNILAPVREGASLITGYYGGDNYSDYIMMHVDSSNAARITSIQPWTSWGANRTFLAEPGSQQALRARVQLDDGTEFPDAIGGVSWIPLQDMLLLNSSEGGSVLAEGNGNATLLQNHHAAVTLRYSAAVCERHRLLETASSGSLRRFGIELHIDPEHLVSEECIPGTDWAYYHFNCVVNHPPEVIHVEGADATGSAPASDQLHIATVVLAVGNASALSRISGVILAMNSSEFNSNEASPASAFNLPKPYSSLGNLSMNVTSVPEQTQRPLPIFALPMVPERRLEWLPEPPVPVPQLQRWIRYVRFRREMQQRTAPAGDVVNASEPDGSSVWLEHVLGRACRPRTPAAVSIFSQYSRIAVLDDAAASDTIGLPSFSQLSVVVHFDDSSCSNFTGDSRVVYSVDEGGDHARITVGSVMAVAPGAVRVRVHLRGYPEAAHLSDAVTLTVVQMETVGLWAQPYPAYLFSAVANVSVLKLVHCTSQWQRATVHAMALLTDGSAVDVTHGTNFSAVDAELLRIELPNVLAPLDSGYAVVLGQFWNRSASLTVTVEASQVQAVHVEQHTRWQEGGTLAGEWGTQQRL
eukprot:gene9509-11267_t